jgi:hypothetical protein
MDLIEIDTATLHRWVREREHAILTGDSISTQRENQTVLDMLLASTPKRDQREVLRHGRHRADACHLCL